jgi:hypothetical protein
MHLVLPLKPGVTLDDRHGWHGSPARLSSLGRAQERASLSEMEWGSECGCGRCSKRSWGAWAGDVAGDLGVRACVSARVLVHDGARERRS